MSTFTQRRDAIKAKLQSIAGVGQVHDRERYAKDANEFLALYRTQVAPNEFRVLGWFFYRESTTEVDLDIAEVRRVEKWRIIGYMGFDDADASANLFDSLIETIAQAFRADRTLGGVVDDIKNLDNEDGPSGVQIDAVGPVMFAGYLCHRAQLSLVTESTEGTA